MLCSPDCCRQTARLSAAAVRAAPRVGLSRRCSGISQPAAGVGSVSGAAGVTGAGCGASVAARLLAGSSAAAIASGFRLMGGRLSGCTKSECEHWCLAHRNSAVTAERHVSHCSHCVRSCRHCRDAAWANTRRTVDGLGDDRTTLTRDIPHDTSAARTSGAPASGPSNSGCTGGRSIARLPPPPEGDTGAAGPSGGGGVATEPPCACTACMTHWCRASLGAMPSQPAPQARIGPPPPPWLQQPGLCGNNADRHSEG